MGNRSPEGEQSGRKGFEGACRDVISMGPGYTHTVTYQWEHL